MGQIAQGEPQDPCARRKHFVNSSQTNLGFCGRNCLMMKWQIARIRIIPKLAVKWSADEKGLVARLSLQPDPHRTVPCTQHSRTTEARQDHNNVRTFRTCCYFALCVTTLISTPSYRWKRNQTGCPVASIFLLMRFHKSEQFPWSINIQHVYSYHSSLFHKVPKETSNGLLLQRS